MVKTLVLVEIYHILQDIINKYGKIQSTGYVKEVNFNQNNDDFLTPLLNMKNNELNELIKKLRLFNTRRNILTNYCCTCGNNKKNDGHDQCSSCYNNYKNMRSYHPKTGEKLDEEYRYDGKTFYYRELCELCNEIIILLYYK